MATENNLWIPPSSSKDPERLNRHQQNGRKRFIKGTGFTERALWDWLMLLGVLAIPVAVAFGTLLFSQQLTQSSQAASERQHQTDIQIANEQQQEATLQIYLDHISDLLLNHKLLASKHSGNEVRDVARIWTLTALQRLDPTRKRVVLKFLYEAGLIGGYDSINGSGKRLDAIVALNDADLSGIKLGGVNLSYVNLSGANLRNADLSQANLNSADLSGAHLKSVLLYKANLNGADLGYTDLSEANLNGANLSSANLGGADLSGADLSQADLSGAQDLTQEQLDKAKTLKGATMPDGSKHP